MIHFKQKLSILLLLALVIAMTLSGCKSSLEEESAALGEVVEDVEQDQGETDLPEKVEPSDTPSTETPEEETPVPTPDQEEETPAPPADEEETPAPDEEEEEEKPDIEYKQENHLKIIDYNIRCVDDGPGKMISERAARFKKLVDQYQPDIMGLQEATVKWIDFLGNNLVGSTYSMYYQYRAEDSKESQPILWNHNKFDVLDKGYFWLSDTPEIPSKGWGSDHYRGCTWIKFKVKATGEVFLFMNTHLTGSNTPATNSGNLIVKRARAMGGFDKYGVFLTGDFNFPPQSAGYVTLTAAFVDVNDALGFNTAYTNNGYNEREDKHKDNWIKDYVMCSENHVLPLKYSILNENIDGGWISDHRGLYVEAALY
ncbi:MAG: endonuclease/exonuclease/phosphatase family protein [Clostridia bacterium]|nr:endonuclease/exonuclease/phosphatase family protein [Clostridia bacterium]